MFFRPEFNFEVGERTGTTDHRGHTDRDAAQAVGALLHGGNGEHLALIVRDGVDDFGDGQADGPPRPTLAANDFG